MPKGKPGQTLKELKDVRKIASTSDYSKIFEHFLIELILEDISHKLNRRQYGGKKSRIRETLNLSTDADNRTNAKITRTRFRMGSGGYNPEKI